MKRPAFLLLILLVGVVAALVMVFNKQIFVQHASVVTLKSFAVKGNIYVDANADGKKGSTEVNYTGEPKPLVRLAVFTEVCRPTPTPKPTVTGVQESPTPTVTSIPTPTPTLAPNCRYFCPRVACLRLPNGEVTCPACTPTCVTPQPTKSIGGLKGTNGKNEGNESGKVNVGQVVSSQVSNNDDIKDVDACHTKPVKVVPCTVNDDGTYTCILNDVTFSRATLILNPPSGYAVTSHNNPFTMKADDYAKNPTATVDFGIANENTITPTPGCFYRRMECGRLCPLTNPNCCPQILVCRTPTPSPTKTLTPTPVTCIPQPECIHTGKCTYATPPGGWCPWTGKSLTNSEINKLLIYLNTLLRQGK